MTTYRVCFCFRRSFRPSSSEPPEVVRKVFGKYSEGGVMGAEQLQRFLAEEQGEAGVSVEVVQAILDAQRREHKHLGVFYKKGLSLDGFFRYLFSPQDNPPLLAVQQDMDLPLSHYFIYTGHNSYLTGNQISSACSDVPIIKALQKGVRVIELDIWPNSTKDDVLVKHGGTLTSPIELINCLRSIKEHAFSASPYPVIITLEDHLTATPDLQAKVAKMIHETFGQMLFIPKSEFHEQFPSPKALKEQIIISTKPPREYLEVKPMKDESELPKGTEEEAWGTELQDLHAPVTTGSQLEHVPSEHIQEEEDHDDGAQKTHETFAPEYKKLIAIAAIKRKGTLSECLHIDPHKVSRLSLNEQALEKAAANHGTELVRFTQWNLLRIYPKGTRVTSSNYNPLLGWIHGAQMVALNMQGHGRSLWLMQGMFRANGGCGYVKKPDILLTKDSNDRVFNPKVVLPVKKTLKVKVCMGDGWRFDFSQSHFDTYSPPDFYTRVGIAGVPADTVMKRTKAIEDNWTPMWDEDFSFPLTFPELALLRIEVHEFDMTEKDDFGGQTCLPVWELKPGFRCVPLYDHKGEKFKSVKLLMRFEFIENSVV